MARLPRVEAAQAIAGSVVLVTGSTRGIGRAVAEALTSRGAHVVLNGRSAEQVEKVKENSRARAGS